MALPKFELFAEGEKNFFAKVADNQIVFETDPEGRATSLIMIELAAKCRPPGDCPDFPLPLGLQGDDTYEIVSLQAQGRQIISLPLPTG